MKANHSTDQRIEASRMLNVSKGRMLGNLII